MYNRYVFGPDGSCRKNRVPEQISHPEPTSTEPVTAQLSQTPAACAASCQYRSQNPLDFLKQMLPQGFDTGDLIVVLLLLLMAGDSREDHDNALLTLALYFIL